MPTQRIFLDWNQPALASAANWLHDQNNLGDHLLVMPGSRAGRRLIELLLEKNDGHLVDPPTLATIGSLANRLITDLPAITSPTVLKLVLIDAIFKIPQEHLDCLIPNAPAPHQKLAWFNLVSPIEKLFNTLGAGGIIPSQVLQEATHWPDFSQAQRWQAITALHEQYQQLLDEHDLHDINLQRIQAITENRIAFEGKIILIAPVDINPLTSKMLEHVADQCTVLIHAPQTLKHTFGDFGQPDINHWHQQPLDIPSNQRLVVDQPTDQVAAMLTKIQDRSQQNQLTNDHITIGVGDEQLGPLVEQLTESAGLPTRWHQQRDILLSRPVSLLLAFNQYCKTNIATDLALLLRHADMQQYLDTKIDKTDHTLLDQYLGNHLQNKLNFDAPGMQPPGIQTPKMDSPNVNISQQLLLQTSQIIDQLIEQHIPKTGSLSQWAQAISDLLSELYSPITLTPNAEEDTPVIDPLSQMADVLRDWFLASDANPKALALLPDDLTFDQACELLKNEIANTPLARSAGKPSVEILGWLELYTDDAPNLYLLNFNEGSIPGSIQIDPFLPDSICQQLGLTCDQSRLARDRYMLEAILNSKEHVQLIAGKTSLSNEPMLPSRLMLQCHDDKLAKTVLDYFEITPQHFPPLLPSLKQTQINIPTPIAPSPEDAITQLSVTAFRAYLNCPYRFYLRYIRKLKSPDPFVPELSPPAFGNLAHDVMQQFGVSDWIDCTDPQALQGYFKELLNQFCDKKYGSHPLPAVQIQREQLHLRLEQFSKTQAKMRSEGWRIIPEKIEEKFATDFPVDDLPFTLIGRIDRMDRHIDTGELRIMDYKTSELSKKPDAIHRCKSPDGDKDWTDLQLPLYQVLAASEIYNNKVQLGYCQLGKQLDKIQFDKADWEQAEINQAIEIAKEVIRKIRRGIFWPPSEPPTYKDGLQGICHDAYPLRNQEIGSLQMKMAGAK